jgi:ABC-type Zn uptake system ZnuABC Zn-binding protein ZnuA
LFALVVLSLTLSIASAQLKVVATIPDLADIAREVGGERVEVKAIAKGKQNIHAVRVKPSHIVAVSRADLFLEMGLSMEHAWVPGLLQTSRNKKVAVGAPGFVNVSEGWKAREVPADLSRQHGTDLHPEGNPHFNLAPTGGRHIANRVLAALIKIDPAGKEAYRGNHAKYLKRLDEAEMRWKKLGERLKGKKVVVYHSEFSYLLAAHGIEVAGTFEPKPGVPPTPKHLAGLLNVMRAQGVNVVLTAPWSKKRQVEEISKKVGARVVELPTMVGGAKGADTWVELLDLLHSRLGEAFEVEVN